MTYEPELGQAMFGNPWMPTPTPRWMSELISQIGNALRKKHGVDPTSNTGDTFSNSVFTMRAYWWGDCTCRAAGDSDCEPTCKSMLPNFEFDGLKVSWYKHALRGSTCNRVPTQEEFAGIYKTCLESL